MHIDKADMILEPAYRPEMLPEPLLVYEHDSSVYPDLIRESFDDGHTEVYVRLVRQPAPQIMECIRIIHKWGQEDEPERRRDKR